MNSFNVYKCKNCGNYYSIPCLFVQEMKEKNEENLCPKCNHHSGELNRDNVYRGIKEDDLYLKSIGKL